MPSIHDYFGTYLKAEDLQGRDVNVTISHVAVEPIKDQKTGIAQEKLVVYFLGKTKGLVLNVTNAKRIAATYSDDYVMWTNAQITLGVEQVESFGEIVPGIRVRPQAAAAAQTAPPPAEHPAHTQPPATAPQAADLDDEIPF